MVEVLTKRTDEGLLVAGLPAFDALSAIASSIRDEKLVVSELGTSVEEDLVSPYGECRVIRIAGNRFIWANGQTATVPHDTTICVIRKPRNWFKGPRELFRGFGLAQGSIKLVYVVDGSKVERSDAYQDRAYRELHGVLGEGKGRFFPTMPILMCLLNTELANELPIMERLRIPRYVEPHHHCPFYDGAVFVGVVSFALPDKHVDRPTQAALFGSDDEEEDAVDWEAEADRQSKVVNGLAWLLVTSTRIARDPPLLLCALRGDTNPRTFLQPPPPAAAASANVPQL